MKKAAKKGVVWAGRAFVGLLLLIVIAGVTVYLLAHAPSGQNFIINMVEDRIDSVLLGELSIGSFRTNLFSRMEVSDVVIRDRYGRSDSVSIKRIIANFNLLLLLFKTVQIHSVLIEGVKASLSVTPDGRYIFPVMPADTVDDTLDLIDSEKVSWRIEIGDAQISGLNAVYIDSSLNFFGRISDASASARFHRIDSISLSLRVFEGYYDSPWWKGSLDTITGTGHLSFTGLEVFDLYAVGSGSQVKGRGKIPFSKFGNWDLSAEVESEMEPVLVIHGLLSGVAPLGRLYGKASWKGTLQRPLLNFRGYGKELRYKEVEVESLYIDGNYGLDSAIKATANLFSSSGNATLNVIWKIPGLMVEPVFGRYSGDLLSEGIDLSLLDEKKVFSRQLPVLKAGVKLHLQGTGIEELPGIAVLNAIISSGNLTDSLSIDAELKDGNWLINSELADNRFHGEGTIEPQGRLNSVFRGDFHNLASLSKIFLGEEIAGRLRFSGNLNGELQGLKIRGEFVSDSMNWLKTEIDSLSVVADYDRGNLRIGTAFVSGISNLGAVLQYFGIDSGGGNLNFELRGSGALDSLNFESSFVGTGFYYGTYRADSAYGKLSMKDSRNINWQEVKVTKDHSEIISTGTININNLQINTDALFRSEAGRLADAGNLHFQGVLGGDSLHGSFRFNEVSLYGLSSWFPWLMNREGMVSGEGGYWGRMGDLRGRWKVKYSNPRLKNERVLLAGSNFWLKDSLLNLDSELFFQGSESSIEFNAEIPLNPSLGWAIDTSGYRTASARIRGDSLDLADISVLLGRDWSAEGPLSIDLIMRNQNRIWSLSGGVTISNGGFRYHPENISVSGISLDAALSGTVQEPTVKFIAETGMAEIPGGVIEGAFCNGVAGLDTLSLSEGRVSLPQGGLLEISGRLPWNNPDRNPFSPGLDMDFEIVKFPLTLISSFFPDNTIRGGELRGSGRVRVLNNRPVLNGQLQITDGEIGLVEIEPSIESINAEISMSADSVFIEQFSGKWGDGRFNGTGAMVWDISGLSSFFIDAFSRDISFEMIDVADVRFNSSRLNLSKTRNGWLLSGNIDLGPSRYFRDIRITDLTGERVTRQPDPLLRSLKLQVRVSSLENLTIDMNLGYLETEGEATLTGTAALPNFTGEIRINSGYVLYLDRNFEIVKGSFSSYDPYEFNPLINLEAQTEVFSIAAGTEELQSYTVFMTLSGTLKEPLVMFRAEGENVSGLSQADIISILTLGQPLGAVGGDLGERLRTFAGESLLGFGSRQLEQILGIERIEIRGDIFAMDSVQSPRLALTKRVGPRLTLSYETMLGNLAQRRILALFRLTRRFFLKGETDSEGGSGIDLIFKLSR